MAKKYEICTLDEDGKVLSKGGIPATKRTVERWIAKNREMYPDELFGMVEYDGRDLDADNV